MQYIKWWILLLILHICYMPISFAINPNTTSLNINSCQNPQINKVWKQAVKENRTDLVITKLYAIRLGLCRLLEKGTIDQQTARLTWEQEVINALEEKDKKVIPKTGERSFRLFGNF